MASEQSQDFNHLSKHKKKKTLINHNDFEEVRWEEDRAADGLIQQLFTIDNKAKNSKEAKILEKKRKRREKQKQKRASAKLDAGKESLEVVKETAASHQNKKSRKNKYWHLAVAAKAERENNTSTEIVASDKNERQTTNISHCETEKKRESNVSEPTASKAEIRLRKKQKNIKSKMSVSKGISDSVQSGKSSASCDLTKKVQSSKSCDKRSTKPVKHKKTPEKSVSPQIVDSESNTAKSKRKSKQEKRKSQYDIAKQDFDSKHKTDISTEKSTSVSSDSAKSKAKKKRTLSDSNDTDYSKPKVARNEVPISRTMPTTDVSQVRASLKNAPQAMGKKPKVPFRVDKLKDILETSSANVTVKPKKQTSAQPLKERMQEKLKSSRFRFLNERLYTVTGTEAAEMFTEDPGAFDVYHEGFQRQVEKWPDNPLDVMIESIKNRSQSLVVADFGCGDARLALEVPQKVHSFDFVALNERVTACDMAHVPLKSNSVDIGVFCLSLMGTNLVDYVKEAHRVLRKGGCLLVAEVVSRFENISSFTRKMTKFGFIMTKKNEKNTMFVWFEFKKSGNIQKDINTDLELHPCVYKKR